MESKDHVYNLSPLVRTTHNWEAVDTREDSAFTYLLNLCRPLVADGDATKVSLQQLGSAGIYG